MIEEIQEPVFFKFIKNNPIVVVDIYTTWCGPCKIQREILNEVANEYNNNVKFVKINLEKCNKIGKQLDIVYIPTIVFYYKGKLLTWKNDNDEQQNKLIGIQSKNKIKKIVDYLIEKK